MKQEHYGDIPHIPKGLDKTAPSETNPPKRTGLQKKVRHKVKELLNNFKGIIK